MAKFDDDSTGLFLLSSPLLSFGVVPSSTGKIRAFQVRVKDRADGLHRIPFYWFFKVIFVLYLGLPQFNGAKLVYKTVVKPVSAKLITRAGQASSVASSLKEKVDAASSATTTGASI
jgi:hypothetical protein